MNTNPVNKFVNTRYRKLMTVTDIDMLFHKKKNNHIRIVECKRTKEGENIQQDDVLKEINNILHYAINNGYKNDRGVPTIEVLKLIGDCDLICESPNQDPRYDTQEVYNLKSFVTKDYNTKEEKHYNTEKEISNFFLMCDKEENYFNPFYAKFYDTNYR